MYLDQWKQVEYNKRLT